LFSSDYAEQQYNADYFAANKIYSIFYISRQK